MNTLTKTFAKRVISMLLVTIMVFSLGIVGLTSASAASVELAETGANTVAGGHVYFDNSTTGWTDSSIQFVIGHSSYSRTYVMSKISNTNLYYVNLSNSTYHDWNDATYYAVVGTSSKWGDGDWGSGNLTNATHYTDAYTTPYDMDADTKHHLVVPASSSNGTSISISYQASVAENLNHNQVVYVYGAEYGSTSYTPSASVGTVSATGYCLYEPNTTQTGSDKTTSTDNAIDYGFARGSTVTFTAAPADGYDFVGWSTTTSESGIGTRTSTTLSYTVQEHDKTYYALFKKSEPDIAITDATATISSESAIVGNPVDITVDYTVTGSESTPTLTLCDANGNAVGNAYKVDVNGKVITVTPPNAGSYTFKVKVEVDGVSKFTNTVSVTYRDKLSAKLTADKVSAYVDDVFTFTVTDNSSQYGGATYELYNAADDSLVAYNDTGVFTLSSSVAGMYTYYVTVRAEGADPVNTNDLTIEVKEKIFNITLSSDFTSILENRDFTITATPEFAQGAVTYKLEATDGTLIEGNTTGIFNVTAKDVAEGAGSEVITYTVTANDGNSEWTATIKITVNEDLGVFPVKIFFKCSDTYGYLPNAKINGEAITLTKSDAIITYNATDSATYSWYSYTSGLELAYGTELVFEVNANRNYFYNASYTVSAGEGKCEFDGTYYCYYLALENLNGGTNTLTNISGMSELNRNWTESAVNMIYDDADALLPVAVNYSYAAMSDANTDGSVNIKDATYIQKSLANIVEASQLSQSVSDVNGDGKVTIKDATAIQKQLAGL